jgi:hypothetical protein
LPIAEWHHEVIGNLTYIANLKCGGVSELLLHRQVPLVVKCRLDVLIPETEYNAREAGVVGAR